MATIKVTNKELFNSRNVEVNLDNISVGDNAASGNITIYAKDEDGVESEFTYWGEHSLKDYERDYGFVLCR